MKYSAGIEGFKIESDEAASGQSGPRTAAPANAASVAASQPNWAQQGQWQRPASTAAPTPAQWG